MYICSRLSKYSPVLVPESLDFLGNGRVERGWNEFPLVYIRHSFCLSLYPLKDGVKEVYIHALHLLLCWGHLGQGSIFHCMEKRRRDFVERHPLPRGHFRRAAPASVGAGGDDGSQSAPGGSGDRLSDGASGSRTTWCARALGRTQVRLMNILEWKCVRM